MRKNLLLLALLFTGFLIQAQDVTSGIRVAVNVSNLDFEPHPSFGNTHRNGVALGAFVDYAFSEKISIMPELMFSAEGGKEKSLRANYIQLPITLRFHFGKLSVGVGPQANLKIWGENDGFETLAFAGVGGVQYDVFENFFVDARYSYGFTDILDDTSGSMEAKNSSFQFGIGLKI